MKRTLAAVLAATALASGAAQKPAADDPYLDVMEAAVSAYSDEHIAKYVREVEAGGVREHGFPRLTANLGVLLSEGRQTGRKDVFRRMMDISCREAAKGKMKGWGGGNDFSVKELAICLVALEKAGTFPEVVTEGWRAALKSVRAVRCADFAMGHPAMPSDGVPYWDYGAPGEERDSSAASVMASGLLELSQLLKDGRGARYRAFAVKQLLSLSSPAYFAAEGENGGFILKHGTGNKPVGKEIDVPLDYGDYYYLEALVRFRRLVEGR